LCWMRPSHGEVHHVSLLYRLSFITSNTVCYLRFKSLSISIKTKADTATIAAATSALEWNMSRLFYYYMLFVL
jgi:hypothetical protein